MSTVPIEDDDRGYEDEFDLYERMEDDYDRPCSYPCHVCGEEYDEYDEEEDCS